MLLCEKSIKLRGNGLACCIMILSKTLSIKIYRKIYQMWKNTVHQEKIAYISSEW